MSKLTEAQMLIAADICDARKATLNGKSTDDEVAAVAWVFDNGIFYLGADGCDLASKMLREAAGRTALDNGEGK